MQISGKIKAEHFFSSFMESLSTGSSKSIIGFARSLLAAGVHLKLLFNNINYLIPSDKIQALDLHSLKYRWNFFLMLGPSHLLEMQILACVIMLLVISGYFIGITSLLHFWIVAGLFTFRQANIGVENVEMLLALLLVPVCLFDERKNHWKPPVYQNKLNNIIQDIFLFLIKLQVAFIYYDSFHDKLLIKEWRNGTVIYYWFTHSFYGLHPYIISNIGPLISSLPMLLFLSWSTLAFEALLAIGFLFSNRYRLLLLKCGIIFHFGILLIHGFSFLFFAMTAALFLYLYPAKKSFSLYITNE